MKKLIVMMAMLGLVVSTQTVMAGGSNHLGLWKEWKAEQAQQAMIAANLSRLEKDAARDLRGSTVRTGQRVLPWGTPAAKGSGN
jgi:hypothetical protein